MKQIEQIREVVADALSRDGHPNREFLNDIRAGRRDDGPYMQGAIAWANRDDARDHAKRA